MHPKLLRLLCVGLVLIVLPAKCVDSNAAEASEKIPVTAAPKDDKASLMRWAIAFNTRIQALKGDKSMDKLDSSTLAKISHSTQEIAKASVKLHKQGHKDVAIMYAKNALKHAEELAKIAYTETLTQVKKILKDIVETIKHKNARRIERKHENDVEK